MATVQSTLAKPGELRQDRLDEKLMKPGKYEVTPDDIFTIEIWLKKVEKRWVLCNPNERGATKEEVVLRMWTYDEMVDLKKMATNYEPLKRIHMIDHDSLNRLKIQKFMVAWTFDRENPRLRIQHVNGIMTDESWKAFAKLSPNICSFIIERMNMIYDMNG